MMLEVVLLTVNTLLLLNLLALAWKTFSEMAIFYVV